MSESIARQTTRGGGRSPLESAQWRIFFVIEALGVATTLGLGLGLLGFAGAHDRIGLGFWLGGVLVGLGVGFVNYVIFKITLRSQLYRFLALFYALIERPRPKVASPFVSTELDDIEDLFGELIAELRGYVDRTVANQVTLERLQRYFSPAVVTQIVENGGMGSTGRAMNVTVLFCDLRGFTALSSKLAPEDVVALLNEYFTAMIDEIYSEQGTVLKLIGDAVMAAFGAPVPSDDDTVRAVRAGCRMQEAFGRLARDRTARGLPTPTGIGIGINRGAVVVG
ncbi:MAG: adenylate/guanylate cyclase domain-containing protein, partial [Chloroflexi bacterium]|nr:adenylate/guanylate cyclase domain-containing protein [Chloroflexota bacterium]